MTRRELLMQALFGTGLVGLRSLATGLPISFLLNPRKAVAAEATGCASNTAAQYLIFSTSGQGDPVNVNAPGTYQTFGSSSPIHPPTFTPTALTINGQTVQAAPPWAGLMQPATANGAPVVNRTCFFHHGTYTVVHPDEHNVLSLMDATTSNEMLVSLLSNQLAPCLGTVQTEPLSIGGGGASETITFQGRPQPNLTPRALGSTLATPNNALANLQRIRDADLDRLNALARSEGNSAQQAFIDRYSQSQRQAREISQSLMGQLEAIPDNSPASQVAAAMILIQMNVTPVITIHIPFGGDNHVDPELVGETAQTTAGVQTIAQMQASLAGANMPDGSNMQDRVSFAMLNVFGRNLLPPDQNGRGHWGNHHCSVLIGKPFQGSVVGGIEPYSKGSTSDFIAQAINPTDGTGVPAGSAPANAIQFPDTLASMALTLGQGLGVDPTFLASNIKGPSGSSAVVTAALAKG
jgi:hypothetical protein